MIPEADRQKLRVATKRPRGGKVFSFGCAPGHTLRVGYIQVNSNVYSQEWVARSPLYEIIMQPGDRIEVMLVRKEKT